MLDPDEEYAFRRALETTKIGPDDELFYRECRAKYMLTGYKELQTELLNRLSVAEKLGDQEEVARIAGELIKVEESIRKIRENWNAE